MFPPRRPKPSRPKKEKRRPGVVLQPQVYQAMQRGVTTLVNAIRPTLGPLPRTVVSQKTTSANALPEILDDGGTIARRMIQLPDREADMGAMYLRHSLWRLHESVGDGTATAAVIFDVLFTQGVRYMIAGGNAMRIRRYLEEGCKLIGQELAAQTLQLQGKERLAALAESICYDPPLARLLGEIFDIIGPYGQLDVRQGRSRELEREYIEGMYWDGAIYLRTMIEDLKLGRATLENPSIFISDLEVKEPQDLLPVLEAAIRGGVKSLLLIVSALPDKVIALLTTPQNRQKIQVVAVKSPAIHADVRRHALDDIAILTGGRVFHKAAGDTFAAVKVDDFGKARRAWADTFHFGLSGGRGDPRQFRQHIAELRAQFQRMTEKDERQRALKRIGGLMGGSAVLWVGANTPLEVDQRKALAQRTADAMRGALRDGVLPGGGVALLACKPALHARYQQAANDDERAAYAMLLQAVEIPARTLWANAGLDASATLAQVIQAGAPHSYDVIRRQMVNAAEQGPFDSAAVLQQALLTAVHGAALALTVDVFIHRTNPPESMETG
jgi:chaperonin GroEL